MKKNITQIIKNNYLFFLLLILFAFLHIKALGSVSFTVDEKIDFSIIQCYVQTRKVFGCTQDISQARLPHYTHALIEILFKASNNSDIHYWFSFFIGILHISSMYVFAKKEFNKTIAIITAFLILTSNSLLASSRMILTHSNGIFTFLTSLLFIQLYYFFSQKKIKYLIFTGILFGLSTAANLLGLFTIIPIIMVVLVHVSQTKKKNENLVLVLCSLPLIAAFFFFAASPIYLDQKNFHLLIQDLVTKRSDTYPIWSYFGSQTSESPWWFSYILFIIKITPWLFITWVIYPVKMKKLSIKKNQQYFLLIIYCSLLIFLTLKSVVIKYDAPHHHIHFFPFTYLTIAVILSAALYKVQWRKVSLLILSILALLHSADTLRFFPQFLFYGSQYSRKLIGEFYGPAVLHCYDQDEVYSQIDILISKNKSIIHADHSCLHKKSPFITQFSQKEAVIGEHYAYLDYLHDQHFNHPGREEYRHHVLQNCQPYYTYFFPNNVPIYQIFKCNT